MWPSITEQCTQQPIMSRVTSRKRFFICTVLQTQRDSIHSKDEAGKETEVAGPRSDIKNIL